jgi:drug/metabolite transporter (DMT)-like permease
MLLGLVAVAAAAGVFGAAAICQARAARAVPFTVATDPRLLLGLVRTPIFWLAIALNLLGFVLHVVALRLLPLFVAQAGISASLAVTALLAVRLLGDRLAPVERLAVAGVCVGLALLSMAAGEAGTAATDDRFTAYLLAGVLTAVGAGAWTSRYTGRVAITVLGCVAGCGFAAVSVATRLVPDLSPGALVTEPAAYVLVLAGMTAFLFYSLALQRGSVTAVTAPLVVVQTVLPAAAGIGLLGDAVRGGWAPVALAGLLLTGGCAVALGRFEAPRAEVTPQQRPAAP